MKRLSSPDGEKIQKNGARNFPAHRFPSGNRLFFLNFQQWYSSKNFGRAPRVSSFFFSPAQSGSDRCAKPPDPRSPPIIRFSGVRRRAVPPGLPLRCRRPGPRKSQAAQAGFRRDRPRGFPEDRSRSGLPLRWAAAKLPPSTAFRH